jgi:activator of HSP90 ATPase
LNFLKSYTLQSDILRNKSQDGSFLSCGDLETVISSLEHEKQSILIFLGSEKTSSETVNSVLQIQKRFEFFFKILLFSANLENEEELQILKNFFFLDPPFVSLYERNDKMLEIDLKNNWEFVKEVIENHLVLEKKNGIEEEEKQIDYGGFLELLEILFMEKKITGFL